MKWYDLSSQPKGCNVTINTAAVAVGYGTQFRVLYNAAAAKNHITVKAFASFPLVASNSNISGSRSASEN